MRKEKFIVLNLSGEVLAEFENEDQAHIYADNYGKTTGRFAYVEGNDHA